MSTEQRIYRPRLHTRKEDARNITIRPPDIRKFEALARYPALTFPWLCAVAQCSTNNTQRITELKHAGYIKIIEAQLKKPNFNERLAYELGEKAITLLTDRGYTIDRHEYTGQSDHRIMSCKVRASFELGTTDRFKLYTWHQLIEMGKIPEKTLKSKTPYMFEIGDARIRPDTYPFVIDHGSSRYFILGVEVDCGTESIRSYDYTRSHIRTKYQRYFTFLKERMYKDILGFPDCLILFTTTSHARLTTMANLWLEFTESKPSLRDNIAFKVFKNEPTGWAMNEPWYLADGSTLKLDQP